MTYHDELAQAVDYARVHVKGNGQQIESVMRAMRGRCDPSAVGDMLRGGSCFCEECYWAKVDAKQQPMVHLGDFKLSVEQVKHFVDVLSPLVSTEIDEPRED